MIDNNTALILIDLQNDYYDEGKFPLPNIETATENALMLLKEFRSGGGKVIHVKHEFQGDAPFFSAGTHGARIRDRVEPLETEVVITKAFPNAFRETSLLDILQKGVIKKLVIVGAMAQMCIDTTARAAIDLAFDVAVTYDAVAAQKIEFNDTQISHDLVQAAFMGAIQMGGAKMLRSSDVINGILRHNEK